MGKDGDTFVAGSPNCVFFCRGKMMSYARSDLRARKRRFLNPVNQSTSTSTSNSSERNNFEYAWDSQAWRELGVFPYVDLAVSSYIFSLISDIRNRSWFDQSSSTSSSRSHSSAFVSSLWLCRSSCSPSTPVRRPTRRRGGAQVS